MSENEFNADFGAFGDINLSDETSSNVSVKQQRQEQERKRYKPKQESLGWFNDEHLVSYCAHQESSLPCAQVMQPLSVDTLKARAAHAYSIHNYRAARECYAQAREMCTEVKNQQATVELDDALMRCCTASM